MEEEEHSIEVQIPFLIHCLGPRVEIIPIYVGEMNNQQMDALAYVLTPHFERDDSIMIAVSNFTRWGKQYGFTHIRDENEEIFEGIEKIDKTGMREIEKQDPDSFMRFLERTKVPIDGKNVLCVFLKILDTSDLQTTTKFVRYSQSNHVVDENDSSVSYATGTVTF